MTPEPLDVPQAPVTCIAASHHCWPRTWSASTGEAAATIQATATATVTDAFARGKLSKVRMPSDGDQHRNCVIFGPKAETIRDAAGSGSAGPLARGPGVRALLIVKAEGIPSPSVQAENLAQVADALYGLDPAEFRAARDERASQARAAGDRELGDAISKLRRPTVSAWLVNRLARQTPDEVGRLLELGESLREAQQTLAGDRLRELSAQRRQLIRELTQEAKRLAAQARRQVSDQAEREVEATLEAALADPAAAAAVQSGRLTTGLAYAGMGGIDMAGAVAVPDVPGRARQRAAEAPPVGPDGAERQQAREPGTGGGAERGAGRPATGKRGVAAAGDVRETAAQRREAREDAQRKARARRGRAAASPGGRTARRCTTADRRSRAATGRGAGAADAGGARRAGCPPQAGCGIPVGRFGATPAHPGAGEARRPPLRLRHAAGAGEPPDCPSLLEL